MRQEVNRNHLGWKLSHSCIRDTLLAKREGALQGTPGIFRALYCANIRALRESQLAPYVEKWHANRILEMQTLKRAAPEIIIVVRGGMVQEVRSTNPYTSVLVADYDCDYDDPEHEALLNDAEERGNESDMHIVY